MNSCENKQNKDTITEWCCVLIFKNLTLGNVLTSKEMVMDIEYDINIDDFDSVDYFEYSDECYSREIYSQEYPSVYWNKYTEY